MIFGRDTSQYAVTPGMHRRVAERRLISGMKYTAKNQGDDLYDKEYRQWLGTQHSRARQYLKRRQSFLLHDNSMTKTRMSALMDIRFDTAKKAFSRLDHNYDHSKIMMMSRYHGWRALLREQAIGTKQRYKGRAPGRLEKAKLGVMPKNRGEFVRMLLLDKDRKEEIVLRERREKLKRPFQNARQKEMELLQQVQSSVHRRDSAGSLINTEFSESAIAQYEHGGRQAIPLRLKGIDEQQNHPKTWNHDDMGTDDLKNMYKNKEGDQLYREKFGEVPYLRHTVASYAKYHPGKKSLP